MDVMTNINGREIELMLDELKIRKALQECMNERLLNNKMIMDRLEEELK